MPHRSLTPTSLRLDQARVGDNLEVERITGQSSICHRLREMGFAEFTRLRKITDHGTMVCSLAGSRMALSRELAKHVLVKKV